MAGGYCGYFLSAMATFITLNCSIPCVASTGEWWAGWAGDIFFRIIHSVVSVSSIWLEIMYPTRVFFFFYRGDISYSHNRRGQGHNVIILPYSGNTDANVLLFN